MAAPRSSKTRAYLTDPADLHQSPADYVISTVHRAKGLEWKRVKVANDFRFKTIDGRLMLEQDEMCLLYVAVTRARHVLDISELREELIRLFRSRQ
jgi:superfamily I DNA/RNA helicase